MDTLNILPDGLPIRTSYTQLLKSRIGRTLSLFSFCRCVRPFVLLYTKFAPCIPTHKCGGFTALFDKFISKKHSLRVFIFFVDEKIQKIYGNFLDELEQPRDIIYNAYPLHYPKFENYSNGASIVYFPLDAMITIGDLQPEQTEQLKNLSTRNSAYNAEF